MANKNPEAVEQKPTVELTESIIDGLEDLSVDDKITVILNLKVVRIERGRYDKEKKLYALTEILSGKMTDADIKKDIEEAETIKDLEKVAKKIPPQKEAK